MEGEHEAEALAELELKPSVKSEVEMSPEPAVKEKKKKTSEKIKKEPQPAVRKSSRPRKQSKRVLDNADCNDEEIFGAPQKKRQRKISNSVPGRKRDLLPDDKPFSCSLCGSPYINTSPHRAKFKVETQPIIKEKDGRLLQLCVKCAMAINQTVNKGASLEQKAEFEEEGRQFGQHLASYLKDEEASRLYCSLYQTTKCGCIQNYINGTLTARKKKPSLSSGGMEVTTPDTIKLEAPSEGMETPTDQADRAQRANYLLSLLKESKEKKKTHRQFNLKCYGKDKAPEERANASKEYEQFVLANRTKLKDLGICERGSQKVLCYSNNFLHKKPVGSQARIQRTKGRAALGRLHPLQELPKMTCCDKGCVELAQKNSTKVAQWRKHVTRGQKEMWRVITEMLSPQVPAKACCFKFITMVTGCCLMTIQKVYAEMLLAGHSAVKREHGMRTHWEKHKKDLKHPPQASGSGHSRTKKVESTIFIQNHMASPHGAPTATSTSTSTSIMTTSPQVPLILAQVSSAPQARASAASHPALVQLSVSQMPVQALDANTSSMGNLVVQPTLVPMTQMPGVMTVPVSECSTVASSTVTMVTSAVPTMLFSSQIASALANAENMGQDKEDSQQMEGETEDLVTQFNVDQHEQTSSSVEDSKEDIKEQMLQLCGLLKDPKDVAMLQQMLAAVQKNLSSSSREHSESTMFLTATTVASASEQSVEHKTSLHPLSAPVLVLQEQHPVASSKSGRPFVHIKVSQTASASSGRASPQTHPQTQCAEHLISGSHAATNQMSSAAQQKFKEVTAGSSLDQQVTLTDIGISDSTSRSSVVVLPSKASAIPIMSTAELIGAPGVTLPLVLINSSAPGKQQMTVSSIPSNRMSEPSQQAGLPVLMGPAGSNIQLSTLPAQVISAMPAPPRVQMQSVPVSSGQGQQQIQHQIVPPVILGQSDLLLPALQTGPMSFLVPSQRNSTSQGATAFPQTHIPACDASLADQLTPSLSSASPMQQSSQGIPKVSLGSLNSSQSSTADILTQTSTPGPSVSQPDGNISLIPDNFSVIQPGQGTTFTAVSSGVLENPQGSLGQAVDPSAAQVLEAGGSNISQSVLPHNEVPSSQTGSLMNVTLTRTSETYNSHGIDNFLTQPLGSISVGTPSSCSSGSFVFDALADSPVKDPSMTLSPSTQPVIIMTSCTSLSSTSLSSSSSSLLCEMLMQSTSLPFSVASCPGLQHSVASSSLASSSSSKPSTSLSESLMGQSVHLNASQVSMNNIPVSICTGSSVPVLTTACQSLNFNTITTPSTMSNQRMALMGTGQEHNGASTPLLFTIGHSASLTQSQGKLNRVNRHKEPPQIGIVHPHVSGMKSDVTVRRSDSSSGSSSSCTRGSSNLSSVNSVASASSCMTNVNVFGDALPSSGFITLEQTNEQGINASVRQSSDSHTDQLLQEQQQQQQQQQQLLLSMLLNSQQSSDMNGQVILNQAPQQGAQINLSTLFGSASSSSINVMASPTGSLSQNQNQLQVNNPSNLSGSAIIAISQGQNSPLQGGQNAQTSITNPTHSQNLTTVVGQGVVNGASSNSQPQGVSSQVFHRIICPNTGQVKLIPLIISSENGNSSGPTVLPQQQGQIIFNTSPSSGLSNLPNLSPQFINNDNSALLNVTPSQGLVSQSLGSQQTLVTGQGNTAIPIVMSSVQPLTQNFGMFPLSMDQIQNGQIVLPAAVQLGNAQVVSQSESSGMNNLSQGLVSIQSQAFSAPQDSRTPAQGITSADVKPLLAASHSDGGQGNQNVQAASWSISSNSRSVHNMLSGVNPSRSTHSSNGSDVHVKSEQSLLLAELVGSGGAVANNQMNRSSANALSRGLGSAVVSLSTDQNSQPVLQSAFVNCGTQPNQRTVTGGIQVDTCSQSGSESQAAETNQFLSITQPQLQQQPAPIQLVNVLQPASGQVTDDQTLQFSQSQIVLGQPVIQNLGAGLHVEQQLITSTPGQISLPLSSNTVSSQLEQIMTSAVGSQITFSVQSNSTVNQADLGLSLGQAQEVQHLLQQSGVSQVFQTVPQVSSSSSSSSLSEMTTSQSSNLSTSAVQMVKNVGTPTTCTVAHSAVASTGCSLQPSSVTSSTTTSKPRHIMPKLMPIQAQVSSASTAAKPIIMFITGKPAPKINQTELSSLISGLTSQPTVQLLHQNDGTVQLRASPQLSHNITAVQGSASEPKEAASKTVALNSQQPVTPVKNPGTATLAKKVQAGPGKFVSGTFQQSSTQQRENSHTHPQQTATKSQSSVSNLEQQSAATENVAAVSGQGSGTLQLEKNTALQTVLPQSQTTEMNPQGSGTFHVISQQNGLFQISPVPTVSVQNNPAVPGSCSNVFQQGSEFQVNALANETVLLRSLGAVASNGSSSEVSTSTFIPAGSLQINNTQHPTETFQLQSQLSEVSTMQSEGLSTFSRQNRNEVMVVSDIIGSSTNLQDILSQERQAQPSATVACSVPDLGQTLFMTSTGPVLIASESPTSSLSHLLLQQSGGAQDPSRLAGNVVTDIGQLLSRSQSFIDHHQDSGAHEQPSKDVHSAISSSLNVGNSSCITTRTHSSISQSKQLISETILQPADDRGVGKVTVNLPHSSTDTSGSTAVMQHKAEAQQRRKAGSRRSSSSSSGVSAHEDSSTAKELVSHLIQSTCTTLPSTTVSASVCEDTKSNIEPVTYLQCKEVIDLTDDSPPSTPSRSALNKGRCSASESRHMERMPQSTLLYEELQKQNHTSTEMVNQQTLMKISSESQSLPQVSKTSMPQSQQFHIQQQMQLERNLNSQTHDVSVHFNPESSQSSLVSSGSKLLTLSEIPADVTQCLIDSLKAYKAGDPNVQLVTHTFTPSDNFTCQGLLPSGGQSQQVEDQVNEITRAITENKCPSAVVTISTSQRFQQSLARARPPDPSNTRVSVAQDSTRFPQTVLISGSDAKSVQNLQGARSLQFDVQASTVETISPQLDHNLQTNVPVPAQSPSRCASTSHTSTTSAAVVSSGQNPLLLTASTGTVFPSQTPGPEVRATSVVVPSSVGRPAVCPVTSSAPLFMRTSNTPTDAVGPPNITIMSPTQASALPLLRFRRESRSASAASPVVRQVVIDTNLKSFPLVMHTSESLSQASSAMSAFSDPTKTVLTTGGQQAIISQSPVMNMQEQSSLQVKRKLSLTPTVQQNLSGESSSSENSAHTVDARSADKLTLPKESPRKARTRTRPSTVMDLLKRNEEQQAASAVAVSPNVFPSNTPVSSSALSSSTQLLSSSSPACSTAGPVTLMFSSSAGASKLLVVGASTGQRIADSNALNVTVKNLQLLAKGSGSPDMGAVATNIAVTSHQSGFTMLQPNMVQLSVSGNPAVLLNPSPATSSTVVEQDNKPIHSPAPTSTQLPSNMFASVSIPTPSSSQQTVLPIGQPAVTSHIIVESSVPQKTSQSYQRIGLPHSSTSFPHLDTLPTKAAGSVVPGSEHDKSHRSDHLQKVTEPGSDTSFQLIGQPQVASVPISFSAVPPGIDSLGHQSAQSEHTAVSKAETLKFKISSHKNAGSGNEQQGPQTPLFCHQGDLQGRQVEENLQGQSAHQNKGTLRLLLQSDNAVVENIKTSSSDLVLAESDLKQSKAQKEQVPLSVKSPQLLQLMKGNSGPRLSSYAMHQKTPVAPSPEQTAHLQMKLPSDAGTAASELCSVLFQSASGIRQESRAPPQTHELLMPKSQSTATVAQQVEENTYSLAQSSSAQGRLPSANPLLANILFASAHNTSPAPSAQVPSDKQSENLFETDHLRDVLGGNKEVFNSTPTTARFVSSMQPTQHARNTAPKDHGKTLELLEKELKKIPKLQVKSISEADNQFLLSHTSLFQALPVYTQPPRYEVATRDLKRSNVGGLVAKVGSPPQYVKANKDSVSDSSQGGRIEKVIEDIYKFPDEGDEPSPPPTLSGLKSHAAPQKFRFPQANQKHVSQSLELLHGSSDSELQKSKIKSSGIDASSQQSAQVKADYKDSSPLPVVMDAPQNWKSPKKVRVKKDSGKGGSKFNPKKVQFSDVVTSKTAPEYGQPITVNSPISQGNTSDRLQDGHTLGDRSHCTSGGNKFLFGDDQFNMGHSQAFEQGRQDGQTPPERYLHSEQSFSETRDSRLKALLSSNIEQQLAASRAGDQPSRVAGLYYAPKERLGHADSPHSYPQRHGARADISDHYAPSLIQRETETFSANSEHIPLQRAEMHLNDTHPDVRHSKEASHTFQNESPSLQGQSASPGFEGRNEALVHIRGKARPPSQFSQHDAFLSGSRRHGERNHSRAETHRSEELNRSNPSADGNVQFSLSPDSEFGKLGKRQHLVARSDLQPSTGDDFAANTERDLPFDRPTSFNILNTQGYSKLHRQRLRRPYSDQVWVDESTSMTDSTQLSVNSSGTNDTSSSSDQCDAVRNSLQHSRWPVETESLPGYTVQLSENVERRPSESPLIRQKILESNYELARQMEQGQDHAPKSGRQESFDGGRGGESSQKIVSYPERRLEGGVDSFTPRENTYVINREAEYRTLPGAGSKLTSPIFAEPVEVRPAVEGPDDSIYSSLHHLNKEIQGYMAANEKLKLEVAKAEHLQRHRQLSSSERLRALTADSENAERAVYTYSTASQSHFPDDSVMPLRKRHSSSAGTSGILKRSPLPDIETQKMEDGIPSKIRIHSLSSVEIRQMLESDTSPEEGRLRSNLATHSYPRVGYSSDDHSLSDHYMSHQRDSLVASSSGGRPSSQIEISSPQYESLRHRYPSAEMKPLFTRGISEGEGFIPVGEHQRHRNLSSSLGVRAPLDLDPPPYDSTQRQRNPSASSLKSFFPDPELANIDLSTRSRNPSSSSWVKIMDLLQEQSFTAIRSRNPSGSSNRRSRPGSSSSDRELPVNMDELPFFSDIARTRSRNSSGESIEPTMDLLLDPQQIMQLYSAACPRQNRH